MIENYESKYFAIGIFHSIYPFIYTDEVFNYLILVYMYNYEGSCVVVLRISNYSVHEIFLLLFCFSCCCHKVLLYLGLSRIGEFVIIKLVVIHHCLFNEYFLWVQRRQKPFH